MKRRKFIEMTLGAEMGLGAGALLAPQWSLAQTKPCPPATFGESGGVSVTSPACPVVATAGSVAHGQTFTVPGGGYGTRTVLLDRFDDCSGTDITTLWNGSAGMKASYRTPASVGRSIAVPHNNITKYVAGVLNGDSSSYFNYNIFLIQTIPNVAIPNKVFCSLYRRVDPRWVFGSECGTATDRDNNFKWLGVASRGFWDNYWYHDCTNQKCSLDSAWGNSFYNSGGLGGLQTTRDGIGGVEGGGSSNSGGSSELSLDPWHNWVKFEYRFGLGPSGQSLRFLINNITKQYRSSQNTDNAPAGSRTIYVGAYARSHRSENNWIYMADIALVVGPDAYKRVVLTNSASYAGSSIVEFQPIQSWNGTVTARCNKGRLSAGTAHCHIFDANDVGHYAGPVTLS